MLFVGWRGGHWFSLVFQFLLHSIYSGPVHVKVDGTSRDFGMGGLEGQHCV